MYTTHTLMQHTDSITRSKEYLYIRELRPTQLHLRKCSSRKRERGTEKEMGREGDMIGRKARHRG